MHCGYLCAEICYGQWVLFHMGGSWIVYDVLESSRDLATVVQQRKLSQASFRKATKYLWILARCDMLDNSLGQVEKT
jgi:hypothetical protein